MSHRLPMVSGREVVRALERAGLAADRERGSHVTMRGHGRAVTVPVHSSEDLPPGTVASILRQASLTGEQFLALL